MKFFYLDIGASNNRGEREPGRYINERPEKEFIGFMVSTSGANVSAVFVFLHLVYFITMSLSYAADESGVELEIDRQANVDKTGLALHGYDPVSYFIGIPLVGDSDYSVVYKNIRYQFASGDNLEQFTLTPEKFLPAFGGWCAWAMLDGEKVDVNPERFQIIDGANFLFYDGFWGDTLKKWNKLAEKEGDPALVRQAGEHWQKIVLEEVR